MSRVKRPVRALFKKFAHTAGHQFPFHILGLIEDQERFVTLGLSEDDARIVFSDLKQHFDNETNTVQY